MPRRSTKTMSPDLRRHVSIFFFGAEQYGTVAQFTPWSVMSVILRNLVSPDFYRQFVLPFDQRIVARLGSLGVPLTASLDAAVDRFGAGSAAEPSLEQLIDLDIEVRRFAEAYS